MENEAIAVIGVIFVGWVGWISITTIQNNVKINSLMSIKDGVVGLKDDIKALSSRLDLFLKNELDTLKDIADNNK